MSDGLVVGTYVAEQVAGDSYALVAATHTEAAKRSAHLNGHRLRKRRLRDNRGFGAGTLPALDNLDPLLSGNVEVKEPQMVQHEDQRRQRRLEQIEISSTLLSQGRTTWGDRGSKPRNSQAIASLTAPLPWFRPEDKEPREGLRRQKSFRKGGMRSTDPWDLFDKSLRGTGMERTPKSRSPRRIDIDDHDLFKLTLAEQPLLPEDPVEAYFQSQDSRIEDCHKKGRISWNPDAEAKKKRTSRPVARARVHSFRDPKAMARVASFLDPQNKELRRSLQSTEEFEEIPDRPDLLDQVQRSQKLSPLRRDACQLLRMFVFGAVGNESCKTKRDRENVFFESCGAKDDMLKLIRAWDKIDPEDSGRVEVAEVQRFADRLMIDVSAAQAWHESNDLCVQQDPQRISSRMPIWLANTSPEEWPRFVQRLSERLTAVLQAARKSSFCFEDLMRLIWPCSSVEDLKQMSGWCEEINNTRDKFQVSPPPVLPQEAKDALKAVFDHFDQDGGGKISTNELIMSGLVDKEGAKEFIRKAAAETGEIGLKDFCEMLCPHGYRATEQSVIGSTALGRVARLDKTTRTWRLKDAKPIAAVRYRYSSFGRGSRMNLGIVPGQK